MNMWNFILKKRSLLCAVWALVMAYSVLLPEGAFSVEETGVTIVCKADENPLGYIYFEANPVIHAVVVSRSGEKTTPAVRAEAFDSEKRRIWQADYSVPVEAYGTAMLDIFVEAGKFGLYSLSLTAADPVSGKVLCQLSQEFSIANRPRDGAVNSSMALCDHTDPANRGDGLGHGYDELDRKMELFSKAGFCEIRQEYYWNAFEPTTGSLGVPDSTRKVMNSVREHNMGMMGILMGFPQFTSGNPPTTDKDLEKWAKFVEYAAANTDDVSEYYELWNEINVPRFNPANITPEQYVNLLEVTYPAVKAGNPDGKLCGFGLANIGERDEGYEMTSVEWIERILKAGGGEYMDAASIHGYNSLSPESARNSANGRTWLLDETRALLDKYGYEDMPIIVSEMGWSTLGVTEENQAWYMLRYAAIHYGKYEKIYWYVSQEKQIGEQKEEDGFGILRTWDEKAAPHTPYGAKPAFLALSNFNAFLAGAELQGKVDTGDSSVYRYQFTDRFGQEVSMLWTTASSGAIQVDAGEKYAAVYDMYGNGMQFSDGGVMTVALSQSPVYVRLTDEPEDIAAYRMDTAVDYNTGVITVSGVTTQGGAQVGLSVIRQEAAMPALEDILFLGQSAVDREGRYKFVFQRLNAKGIYNVKAGFSDSGDEKIAQLQLNIEIPDMRVTVDGAVIRKLSQLSSGQKLHVSLEGISGLTGTDATLVAAQFRNGSLIGAEMEELDSGLTAADEDFAVENPEDIDEVKIFFWGKWGIQPLMGVYRIEK